MRCAVVLAVYRDRLSGADFNALFAGFQPVGNIKLSDRPRWWIVVFQCHQSSTLLHSLLAIGGAFRQAVSSFPRLRLHAPEIGTWQWLNDSIAANQRPARA